VFGLFIACGGDVGKMEAAETIVTSEWQSSKVLLGWKTRDDLMQQYHNRAELVDQLINRCEAAWPPLYRDHPEFPGNKAMWQYKTFDSHNEELGRAVTKTKSLHWTGIIDGNLALEMAQNIERMFALPSNDTDSGAAASATPKPRPKGKAKARPKGNVASAQVDPSDTYLEVIASRVLELHTILATIRAGLDGSTWSEGLVTMINTELLACNALHARAIACTKNLVVAELDAVSAEFAVRHDQSRQYIVAGDNMLGNKKPRKLPAIPVKPSAVKPAADASVP
jgi:hypothetical protein